MQTPPSLKSAANCLIAIGLLYIVISSIVLIVAEDAETDTFRKIFIRGMLVLGLLLWLAAFLLYRRNKAGRFIWWLCCPFAFLQFPIGTVLSAFVFIYLGKPEAKAVLAGQQFISPPPIHTPPHTDARHDNHNA